MAVTLRDIAKHVNLSHATVSFVLNDRRDVAIPETTRQRVMEAAKELGYHPNRAARALVLGRTRVVGIWTPSLASSYVQRLFQGLTDRFREAGFDSLYCRNSEQSGTQQFEWPVDGIVCLECGDDQIQDPLPDGVPAVIIGSRTHQGPDSIQVDLGSGTVQAIMHLLESGKTRIACISGEQFEGDGSIRDSYRKIMDSAGRASRYLTVSSGTPRERYTEILNFLQGGEKVDAVFCTSGELSGLARRALFELRLSVPRDVALVGFDYSDEFEYRVPSLTSVEIPVELIAELASKMLMARMKDVRIPIQKETVRTNLRILESSSPTSGVVEML